LSEEEGKKERKKESVIITCNNYSKNNYSKQEILSQRRVVKSFSFPAEHAEVLFEFEKIAKREHGKRGFSQLLQEMIVKYVAIHGSGNNQLKLPAYLDESSPSPNMHLCNYSRGHTNAGKIFCTNPSVIPVYDMTLEHGISGKWIQGVTCYGCRHNKLRK
jgi:hypothetical protein